MQFKRGLLFLLCFLFVITFISAQETYPTQKVNQEFNFSQVCADATYITLSSIQTPNGTEFVNSTMIKTSSGEFSYNYTPTQIGRYDFRGVSDGCLKTFAVFVPVTPSGQDSNIQTAMVQILLVLFFVSLFLLTHYLYSRINFERWHNNIINKYENKNYVKLVFSSISYNIMKNSFVIYYLIGFPIITTLTDIAYGYNLINLVSIFKTLLVIYSVGAILVAIYLFGNVQEWLVDLLEKIRDMDWGVNIE